jgi:Fic family protein
MHQVEGYSTRAGQYLKQVNGYRAFIPKPLPPDPPLNIDSELLRLLSEADLELGRLDGATDILPNPGLFVAMYVRKEAVLSSQIEGTQASLVDVLEYEANVERRSLPSDVGETANYVKALNLGLAKLEELPLCNRLLREIHEVLMQGVRGEEKAPGEFRQSQNWIGMPGCDLSTATFIPPPPHEVQNAMGSLELYLHNDTQTPVLIKCGLVHGQFETIHPFLGGNGRLGRLLVTFLLCEQKVLRRPLLYLSAYFKRHQDEYYELLQAIHSSGDWQSWLKFFLKGVKDVSREATETARRVILIREQHRQAVIEKVRGQTNGLTLLDPSV